MSRISRFAFEGVEEYQVAHALDALCRRIEAEVAPAQRARAARVREHSCAACRWLAHSSAARTRRRAVTAARAAHHAAEDVQILLRNRAGAAGAALPHGVAASRLAARLLMLLAKRLRELRRPPAAARPGALLDDRALTARRN